MWLSLRRAAEHLSLSEKTLRRHIGHWAHPLPVHWVAGRWLVEQSELDDWVRSYPPRTAGEVDAQAVVEEILENLR
jgi:hypothetical protein